MALVFFLEVGILANELNHYLLYNRGVERTLEKRQNGIIQRLRSLEKRIEIDQFGRMYLIQSYHADL